MIAHKNETIENAEMLYDRIEAYIEQNGYAPTMREIGKMLGTTSMQATYNYLKMMRSWGWLDWRTCMARTITLKRSAAE